MSRSATVLLRTIDERLPKDGRTRSCRFKGRAGPEGRVEVEVPLGPGGRVVEGVADPSLEGQGVDSLAHRVDVPGSMVRGQAVA